MESVGKKRKKEEPSSLEEFRKKRKINGNDELIIRSFTRHGEFNHVLPEIFRNLDVQRLKICRLVCKAWDEEACTALRNTCVVFLHSAESRTRSGRIRDFMKLLEIRDPEFPMPFKAFKMEENLDDSQYRKYLKMVSESIPDFEIYSLYLIEPASESSLSESCLQKHARALKSFTIHKDGDDESLGSLPAGIQFPELEKLHIEAIISLTKLGALINSAPKLKQITGEACCTSTEGTLPELRQMMSEPNFMKIDTFHGHNDAELQHLEDLTCLKNVKSLRMTSFDGVLSPRKPVRGVGSMRRFLPRLTRLDIGQLYMQNERLIKRFPLCQNLKHLEVEKISEACRIMRRCPSLKSISFQIFDLNTECNDERPCETVETLDCTTRHEETPFPSYAGLALRQLFPNWVNFRIAHPGFFKAGFPSQSNVFEWNIQWLTLSGNVSFPEGTLFEFLTGLKIQAHRKSDKGPKVAQPDSGCLKGLKSLVLHYNCLTDHFVEDGLSRLGLDRLQFYWNESLSVEKAVRNLRHIPDIAVIGCCKPKFSRQMELLFSRLAAVRCGCGLIVEDECEGFVKSFDAPEKPVQDGLTHLCINF